MHVYADDKKKLVAGGAGGRERGLVRHVGEWEKAPENYNNLFLSTKIMSKLP